MTEFRKLELAISRDGIKINGKEYSGTVLFNSNVHGDVSATFVGGLEPDEINDVLSATELFEIADDTKETLSVYSLIKWRSMERIGNNLKILWQTYVLNEVESIRQDNEDLTQAVLELAQIVGGDANG